MKLIKLSEKDMHHLNAGRSLIRNGVQLLPGGAIEYVIDMDARDLAALVAGKGVKASNFVINPPS